ncbi:transposase family protein [Actinokineospora cianjurensis]|uniref:DDE superfamily endonuclease n=1 Tax=Actinokineospora cianjurensis TaxID=585224 RepID=A0A421B7N5_9PSEU|nr:transposase family protein [Actinokineospora cianjurensis]RLK60526.1 DDE superfamily endonuclease [Actinokineospora cianjurensis]
MYHTTGLRRDQVTDLCATIHRETVDVDRRWPPCLGLFTSVVVALTYLRRNRVQVELAETFGVSQSTISRAITAMTPLPAKLLAECVPTVDELDSRSTYIVDGTLLPCWSWVSREKTLYSGKHRTTGLNVQVARTLDGRLAWVSDPLPGNWHDTRCLTDSGVLDRDVSHWMGDKAYVGMGILTPIRTPARRELVKWERNFNHEHNAIRVRVEHAIANLKTWRILHTDYRRPLATFATTITAVLGLQFYRQA